MAEPTLLRGRRVRVFTQMLGYAGWNVVSAYWESADGERLEVGPAAILPRDARLILCPVRHWAARCGACHARCDKPHDLRRATRRWEELPAFGHRVFLEYAPQRWKCPKCGGAPVEALAWGDSYQHETTRFQQQVAFDALCMPVSQAAAKYGLPWANVFRCVASAILRWNLTRPKVCATRLGMDEKYLGRRGNHPDKYVTIISNLDTGEPIWYGWGRSEATVKLYLDTLRAEEKSAITLVAMDMHQAFANAIRNDPALKHVAIVHDPFHVLKRVGEAVTEVRRATFFRAGAELRAVGRGTAWLVLRAWENTSEEQKATLKRLFSYNLGLARAYQIKEEMREVLRADTGEEMRAGLEHVLKRTQRRSNIPLRRLHDSLVNHREAIVALGTHRPPVGRVEALNNNWETQVRQGRGYRNVEYLFHRLRFVTANPLHSEGGIRRFLAIGQPPPLGKAAA